MLAPMDVGSGSARQRHQFVRTVIFHSAWAVNLRTQSREIRGDNERQQYKRCRAQGVRERSENGRHAAANAPGMAKSWSGPRLASRCGLDCAHLLRPCQASLTPRAAAPPHHRRNTDESDGDGRRHMLRPWRLCWNFFTRKRRGRKKYSYIEEKEIQQADD
jgi:hypothetical protein